MQVAHRTLAASARASLTGLALLLLLAPPVLFGYGNNGAEPGPAVPLADGSAYGHRVAFVKPVFTATAYSSFYDFYNANQAAQADAHITSSSSIRLLNARVLNTWGWSDGLHDFLNSKLKGAGVAVLTDLDVHQGKLFQDGHRAYDVLVLGFSEYVTAAEYHQYQRFASSGGTIIFLDATQFLAEVQYHPESGTLSLVKGHGWVFNGTSAWRGPFHRWFENNTAWIGSNYGAVVSDRGVRFHGAVATGGHPVSQALEVAFGPGPVFKNYHHHEENTVVNPQATIIAKWDVSGVPPGTLVAAYELKYGAGRVLHTGVFGSDLIGSDPQMQYFLLSMLSYAISSYWHQGHAV